MPLAQVVGPVQFWPPHCPQRVCPAPEAVLDVVRVVEEEVVRVDEVEERVVDEDELERLVVEDDEPEVTVPE